MQNRTREFIKKLGVKQRDLAAELGMTTVGLQQLMKTEHPKIATLEKIATAIGVPTWQLFLSDEEIEAVVAMHRKENAGNNTVVCPHCGATLHVELTMQDAPKDAHPA